MRSSLFLILLFLSDCILAQEVITSGHSHNDYKQKAPLHEALSHGYTSLEVDVFLYKGEIRVAHTGLGLPLSKTLESLYIQPLSNLCANRPNGIYGDSTILVLMIDLKNKREALIHALQESLLEYKHLFLHQTGVKTKWAPLQLVISGGPPLHVIERQEEEGFLFVDLPVKRSYSLQEYSVFCSRRSAAWGDFFTWNGHGTIPLDEKKLLDELVLSAHTAGYKIRFWAIPETEPCWDVLLESGVDWINIDALAEFAVFYKNKY